MTKSRSRRLPTPKGPDRTKARLGRGGPSPGPGAAAEAWHRQGVAAYAARGYETAIDRLEKAIALFPRVALWHTQLGVALRAAGRLAEAIAAHRRAVALDPGLAAAHNNLGNALRAQGEREAAEAELREAFRLDPHYAEPYCNLGQLLRERNWFAEAEALCRRALEIRPDYVEAQRELGILCERRGDFAAAEALFRKVCAARPSDAEALMVLGAALEGQGHFEEADHAYDRAVAAAPDAALAYFARARRFAQAGDAAAAALHYRQALKRQPRMANAYMDLANLPGAGLGAEDKRAIAALLAVPDLAPHERSSLYYALARAAERKGEWDAAFRWAQRANDIDRARTTFDETATLAFVRATIAAFPPDFAAALSPGSLSERPIFIVGMPRSGTTLVEEIIASHPQAAAGGELVTIPELANRLTAPDRPYPQCVRALDAARSQQLAQHYLERLDRVSATALRVTDKLPFNFRHLGLITALFPRARIIHCRRDPRDVAVSCYFIKFHRPISFACDLFELGAYLRHYEILMAHWRRVLPGRMLEVQYEDLVVDPEREVRRLIDFCGLPWDESVLRFHEGARTVRTASANQVRRPIYASAIGRWQHYGKHLLALFAELEGRPSLAPRPHAPPRHAAGSDHTSAHGSQIGEAGS